MSESADVQIVDSPSESRYEISVDGALAGYLTYERQGATTVLEHTKVFSEYGGRGLAGRLVSYALDDIRASGASVDPQCEYVDAYINKNPEYADLRI